MTQFQELTLTRGFQSSVAPRLHFGIGKADQVEELKVVWPDATIEVLKNVGKNQLLAIAHGNAGNNFVSEHGKHEVRQMMVASV